MNELTKMGFTYDVTQLSPEGEIVDHQIVHNIIPNEGIRALLNGFFPITNLRVNDTLSKNSTYDTFIFNFMESDYSPKATDTWLNEAASLYGCDGTLWNAVIGSNNPLKKNPFRSSSKDKYPSIFELVTGSNNLVKLIDEISYTFNDFRTITGIFAGVSWDTHISPSVTWEIIKKYTSYRLLSAALFYTPIQMVPKGTLKFTPSFTLIPA